MPAPRSRVLICCEIGRAAVHGHDPNADALGVLVNRLRDLHRQLAGRDEHQPAGRPLGLGVAGEALQQGQREGGGLSGARRRLGEQIPAGDQQRDGFALDRGRLLVSERGHCGGQLVDQAETGKAACCYVGCLVGHVASIVVPGGGARNLAGLLDRLANRLVGITATEPPVETGRAGLEQVGRWGRWRRYSPHNGGPNIIRCTHHHLPTWICKRPPSASCSRTASTPMSSPASRNSCRSSNTIRRRGARWGRARSAPTALVVHRQRHLARSRSARGRGSPAGRHHESDGGHRRRRRLRAEGFADRSTRRAPNDDGVHGRPELLDVAGAAVDGDDVAAGRRRQARRRRRVRRRDRRPRAIERRLPRGRSQYRTARVRRRRGVARGPRSGSAEGRGVARPSIAAAAPGRRGAGAQERAVSTRRAQYRDHRDPADPRARRGGERGEGGEEPGDRVD